MSNLTATTTAASAMLAVPLADEQPAYRYAGDGKFEPANAAAHEEVRCWNDFADLWNARTAAEIRRQ